MYLYSILLWISFTFCTDILQPESTGFEILSKNPRDVAFVSTTFFFVSVKTTRVTFNLQLCAHFVNDFGTLQLVTSVCTTNGEKKKIDSITKINKKPSKMVVLHKLFALCLDYTARLKERTAAAR